MSENNERSKLALFIHWAARLTGIAIGGLFLLFFVGEGNFSQLMQVSAVEWALIACIPMVFIIGVILAWKWEMLGGVVILASVLAFNAIDIASSKAFSGEVEFAFVLVPGILFILSAFLTRRGSLGGQMPGGSPIPG